MGFLHGIEWILFHGHLDYFQKSPLGGRSNTKSLGDHGTPNAHNHWFILFYRVWGPAWIEIHWNSTWLRPGRHIWPHHYTWGYVATLHDIGAVLGQPLDAFFWVLKISWTGLLPHVWSGPRVPLMLGPLHTIPKGHNQAIVRALGSLPKAIPLRAGSHGSQVPSPTRVSKSQHGGEVPTCELQAIIKIWLIIIKVRSWLFYAKIFARFGLIVGSSFLLDPTQNKGPKPRL